MDQLSSNDLRYSVNSEITQHEALQRSQRIRASCEQAFIWLDSNEDLRRLLSARSRPPALLGLHPGCQVYIWAPPKGARSQHNWLQDYGAGWDGPGVVVGTSKGIPRLACPAGPTFG